MIRAWLVVAAVWGGCAWCGDDFLGLLRKAESRSQPRERLEYFSRALAAWTPAHSRSLQAHCVFRKGEAEYESHDFRQAWSDLAQALESDPRNARAWFLRGMIKLHEARAERSARRDAAAAKCAVAAARDFVQHSALKPEDPAGWLALGASQALALRLDSALDSIGRARELAPADPQAPREAGQAYMLFSRWDRALAELDDAYRLSRGRDAQTLLARALCRISVRDEGGARSDLDRGLPIQEELLIAQARTGAHPADIEESHAAAGEGYRIRGTLREKASDRAGALADYDAGCRHGNRLCCDRSKTLRDRPAAAPAPRRPRPAPRRKIPKPKSDPGDRIYGG
ncbi:MAG: hypothetical protein PHF00_02600 [Elusimicrobia bacterium]|nr:hypothetical protein [Elusimicrobiota bacterium]